MRRKLFAGQTSVSVPISVQDTSSTTGGGLSGLTAATSGLVAEYRRRGDSAWTAFTLITTGKTLGTFKDSGAAGSGGGFVADGALGGDYELDLPDAACAAGARWVAVRLRGATNMLPVRIEIELDAVNYQDATRFGLGALPNANAGTSGSGLPILDASGRLRADLRSILGSSDMTEGAGGRMATALQTFLNVASPVHTVASVNNSGDPYAVVNSGTFGNAALLSAIQNVQNNTFIATSIPSTLERPDSGSVTVSIAIVFSDETGTAKNLDSGNPIITLVDDAGNDCSSRLGAFTNPATGKYLVPYTSSSTDDLEGLHWDITGTINSKLRRMVAYMQIVDTTAADFTSSDRTILQRLDTDYTTARAAKIDNLDATVSSRSTFSGGAVASVTGAVGSIGAGGITAGSIASGALNGKGDWLLASAWNTFTAGMTNIAQWLGAFFGKQTPNSTALAEIRATGAGSGGFDSTTDSAEAIRDRGDQAWTTGGGGGGDPWATDLPGSYTSGQAGNILAAIATNVAAILGTGPSGIRAACAMLLNSSLNDAGTEITITLDDDTTYTFPVTRFTTNPKAPKSVGPGA